MTEKKKNLQVRTSERGMGWLKDRQYERWKATGVEPTYEELLDELIFGEHSDPTEVVEPPGDDGLVAFRCKPDHVVVHQLVEIILADPEEAPHIRKSAEVGADYTKRKRRRLS